MVPAFLLDLRFFFPGVEVRRGLAAHFSNLPSCLPLLTDPSHPCLLLQVMGLQSVSEDPRSLIFKVVECHLLPPRPRPGVLKRGRGRAEDGRGAAEAPQQLCQPQGPHVCRVRGRLGLPPDTGPQPRALWVLEPSCNQHSALRPCIVHGMCAWLQAPREALAAIPMGCCANVRRACVRPARSADGAHFCVGGHRWKWGEGRN